MVMLSRFVALPLTLKASPLQHHDFIDPLMHRSLPETQALIDGGRFNRLATLLWSLQAPEAGGETHFPRAGGLEDNSFLDCTNTPEQAAIQGLRVPPRTGSATLFYNLRGDGAPDPHSMHAGCPPTEGTKWAVNHWVWNTELAVQRETGYF